MFTIITVAAVTGYFNRAGEYHARPLFADATAPDALRAARECLTTMHHGQPLYKAVGIRVGNRRNSPVLWVK